MKKDLDNFYDEQLDSKKDEEQQRQQRVKQASSYQPIYKDTVNTYTKPKTPKFLYILMVVVLLATSFFLGFYCYEFINPEMALLRKVKQAIIDYSLYDVDEDMLLMAAGKGMLEQLDRYSTFLSPEEFYELMNPQEIEPGMFGISTGYYEPFGALVVEVPIGGDAYYTGIRQYDIIKSIKSVQINSSTIYDSQFKSLISASTTGDKISVLRRNTDNLDLTIYNPEEWETVTLTVDKQGRGFGTVFVEYYINDQLTNMSQPYIQYANLSQASYTNKKIAYVRISEFSYAGDYSYPNKNLWADTQFENFLKLMVSQYPDKDCRLIVDVSGNPGGVNTIIVNIASNLVYDKNNPNGKVTISSLKNERTNYYDEYTVDSNYSKYFNTALDNMIVILTSNRSASASEMLTGAVIDTMTVDGQLIKLGYGTATQVGSQTFGKGISQIAMPIQAATITVDGQRVQSYYAVYVTHSKFYTPFNNFCNHGNGFKPSNANIATNLKAKMTRALAIFG